MIIDIRGFLRSKRQILDLSPYGREHVIVKGSNALYLVPLQCPHQGLPLVGANVRGDVLQCRWHGCVFSLIADPAFPPSNWLRARVLEVTDGKVQVP